MYQKHIHNAIEHTKDKNCSTGPDFCDKSCAKITLGILIIWKFISKGLDEL